MNEQVLTFDESLADSEVQEYHLKDEVLEISLKLWNDQIGMLHFEDVVGLQDTGTYGVSAICKAEKGEFLTIALQRLFDQNVPAESGYFLFHIYDNDDQITMHIIAKSVELRKAE